MKRIFFILALFLLFSQLQLYAQLAGSNQPDQVLRLGVFAAVGSDRRIILCSSQNQVRLILNNRAIAQGTYRIDGDNSMLIVSFTESDNSHRNSLGTFIFVISNNTLFTGDGGQRWVWLQEEMRFTTMDGSSTYIRGANGGRN